MSQINKPTDYFNTSLWTGNGGTQSITGVGFQPDWVWYKSRSNTYNHGLFDSVRGVSNFIQSNSTDAEQVTSGVTSFDSDGFTVGSDAGSNGSGATFVGWSWLGGGTASSNTDGSITSQVSANTTSGFSIVTYASNTVAGSTIGHGLGTVPAMIIVKEKTGTYGGNWEVYHKKLNGGSSPENYYIRLNGTGVESASITRWNDTAPTSNVFTIGSSLNVNHSGSTYVAYCFAEKKGFSKFGSYTGNGNADGTFVYTGFKPAFVIGKSTGRAEDWFMFDNTRSPENVVDEYLAPNTSNAEGDLDTIDFLSNGFKLRTSGSYSNFSGDTLIYMAFAENPLVGTNNIPATAR